MGHGREVATLRRNRSCCEEGSNVTDQRPSGPHVRLPGPLLTSPFRACPLMSPQKTIGLENALLELDYFGGCRRMIVVVTRPQAKSSNRNNHNGARIWNERFVRGAQLATRSHRVPGCSILCFGVDGCSERESERPRAVHESNRVLGSMTAALSLAGPERSRTFISLATVVPVYEFERK
ncbi:uncharacterized protein A4U43_C07F16140 [Asparagus officinalis]|uniref:Uncharacterized protein n=1 Tax=Asparagus officinalis TaxID=4686 RepID=A0A5P1EEB8_ASPOF|nr:uncharacterized protein A4U43_C07F16140 [Asparagus officinalis]